MAEGKQVKIPADIQKMSFEDALGELESIVARLEGGDVALEESIEIYQRGNLLRAYCDGKLRQAQMKIEKITDGGASTKPLDEE